MALAEIHIPDDQSLGTGTFTNTFKPDALPTKKVISSIIINVPIFQISATVNPNRDLVVAIGKADNKPPLDQSTFRMPRTLNPEISKHVLEIQFEHWLISAAALDGSSLKLAGSAPN